MNFENEQLFSDNLPQIRSIQFEGLETAYLKVLYLSRLIFAFILLGAVIVAYFVVPSFDPSWLLPLFGVITLILLIVFILFTPKVFNMKAYGIREKDIIYRSGLIFRSTTIVPFNRVQHVEIKNGPIDRMFKLSSLKIYTAGGSQSDLTIPGLKPETAQKIKDVIITKTVSDEEE